MLTSLEENESSEVSEGEEISEGEQTKLEHKYNLWVTIMSKSGNSW